MSRIPLSADSPDELDIVTPAEPEPYIGEAYIGVDVLMRLNGCLHGGAKNVHRYFGRNAARAIVNRAERRAYRELPDSAAAVADFLARGGKITVCPPAAAAEVNCGDGFGR